MYRLKQLQIETKTSRYVFADKASLLPAVDISYSMLRKDDF